MIRWEMGGVRSSYDPSWRIWHAGEKKDPFYATLETRDGSAELDVFLRNQRLDDPYHLHYGDKLIFKVFFFTQAGKNSSKPAPPSPCCKAWNEARWLRFFNVKEPEKAAREWMENYASNNKAPQCTCGDARICQRCGGIRVG